MFFRRKYFSKPSGPPKYIPGHLRTTKVWLPKRLSCFSISLFITRIAVMTTMIEKTPTKTPSNVRAERNLCAASAAIAMRKLSVSSARNNVARLAGMPEEKMFIYCYGRVIASPI